MSTRVAAAQMGPASEHKPDNVARVEHLLDEAGARGVDLVVLPELALSPYFAVDPDEDAMRWADEPETSPDVALVVEAARRNQVVCVLPIAERRAEVVYNSALVIDRDGTVAGLYRKAHIPGRIAPDGSPLGGEVLYFADGTTPFPVVETSVGRVGVLICADRGFPEAWRVLALNGAEIVAAPYNTSVQVPHDRDAPEGSVHELRRIQHLRMAAAALTNGYVVVAAGKGGVERGVEYVADSQVIDPWGRARARAVGSADELVVAEVDLVAELEGRDAMRQLVRRRPDLYTALVGGGVHA